MAARSPDARFRRDELMQFPAPPLRRRRSHHDTALHRQNALREHWLPVRDRQLGQDADTIKLRRLQAWVFRQIRSIVAGKAGTATGSTDRWRDRYRYGISRPSGPTAGSGRAPMPARAPVRWSSMIRRPSLPRCARSLRSARHEGAGKQATPSPGWNWRDRRSQELIFLDIVLPGMNGFAALRTMRRDPVLADTPVIMISGNEQAT